MRRAKEMMIQVATFGAINDSVEEATASVERAGAVRTEGLEETSQTTSLNSVA
jgi:hypothetical protein